VRRLLIDENSEPIAMINCDAVTDSLLERRLELHPQVALRPEPFGALAYHYDTRRLVFLKHPDVVSVVRELGSHPTVAATLDACGIAATRRPAFVNALASLLESNILKESVP
jgi:putative mycofactocin binding protein MftB